MPAPTNRQPGQTISSADINAVATVANAAEATANSARDAAATQGWAPLATKTAAYTAVSGEAVPADTTAAAFTLTLPAAAVNQRVRVVNVARTGTNLLTVTSASTILGESPCTVPPSGSIDFFCPIAGVWARF